MYLCGGCVGLVLRVVTGPVSRRLGDVHQRSTSGPGHLRRVHTAGAAESREPRAARTAQSERAVSAEPGVQSAADETGPDRLRDDVRRRHTRFFRHRMSSHHVA